MKQADPLIRTTDSGRLTKDIHNQKTHFLTVTQKCLMYYDLTWDINPGLVQNAPQSSSHLGKHGLYIGSCCTFVMYTIPRKQPQDGQPQLTSTCTSRFMWKHDTQHVILPPFEWTHFYVSEYQHTCNVRSPSVLTCSTCFMQEHAWIHTIYTI